jgi:hypothetical protein
MEVKKLAIESEILGRAVLQITEIQNIEAFRSTEAGMISEHQPFYVQCQLDAADLVKIHAMEEAGFRFVEFRLRKQLDINSFHSVNELAYFPYVIKSIRDEENFVKAREILQQSQQDDRFSRDPLINADISMKRLQWYLKKSYENRENEFIWGLFNKNSGELLGFKTIALNNKKQVVIQQTAIRQELDIQKFTFMLDALVISHYTDQGISYFYSVTSGFNLMEVDLHVSDLKYKNISSTVILRKIYQ